MPRSALWVFPRTKFTPPSLDRLCSEVEAGFSISEFMKVIRASEKVVIWPGKARIYEAASLKFQRGLLSGQREPGTGEFKARAGIPS